jgi:hypothetical protein
MPQGARLIRMRFSTLLVVPAALLVAGCASAAAPNRGTNTTPAVQSPAAAAITQTPVAAATTQSPTQAVGAWWDAGGKSAWAQLVAALTGAGKANPSDTAAFQVACAAVAAGATAVQSAGPVPYAPAEKWLAKALAEYSAGASDCQAGVQGSDGALLQKSAAEIVLGNTDLAKSSAALSSIGM